SENRRPMKTRKQFRYVQSFVDSEGTVRHYFRRRGYPRTTLPNVMGTPEFILTYTAALNKPPLVPASSLSSGVRVRRGWKPDTVQPLIGVYLLLRKGKVVYVGSSLNMPQRVADHQKNGRPFDQAFFIATKANQREALEQVLIAPSILYRTGEATTRTVRLNR